MSFKNYYNELKRRNVIKSGLAYLVVGWIILQVVSLVFPILRIPDSAIKLILVILILGFPGWLIFSWKFEITEEGIKKTKNVAKENSITSQTSNQLNYVIIGALILAIILLAVNTFENHSLGAISAKKTTDKNKITSVEDKKGDKIKSVAVLAFKNMSSDEEQEYFSDGISEEILNQLAKNRELEVISRTSSFSYKGKDVRVEIIGKELGVNYVLEGSVRKSGSILRITAQLIDTKTGNHLWSETYDREMEDIFKIQDEIAESVTKKLEASLLGTSSKVVDTEAYTLYLKAKHLVDQRTSDSRDKALALLKDASLIAHNYAPIWELMSRIYYQQGFGNPIIPKDEAYALGFKAASTAVEVDPDYVNGYMELAQWAMTQFDFEKVKTNIEKAIALAPDNPEILRRKGLYMFESISGQIKNNKRALELDPLLYGIHRNLGLFYYCQEDYKEALKELNIFEEYQPASGGTNSTRALVYLGMGKTEQARKALEKEPEIFWKAYQTIMVEHQAGEKEKAAVHILDFINNYPTEALNIADIYAFMGEREKTFEWLHKALEMKDPTLTEGVYYPTFKKFHKDPRWQQLLIDMGVPKENGIPGYKR